MSRFFRTNSQTYILEPFQVPAPSPVPELTSHKVVVDRSGSMSGDIQGMKTTLGQVFAVESLTHESVLTDLYSFSSQGDVTTHWANVPAGDVPALNGPYMKEIDSIQATCCTGISQALFLALKNVDPTRTTGITLFTDGYANDPSSSEEMKSLDRFVTMVQDKHPNVFVNMIGFRDWCDWPRMNAISNALSGKCSKATSFKDVLEAMRDTQALLAGRTRPAIKIPASAGQMVLSVNRSTGQVNASPMGKDMILRGVGVADNIDIYTVSMLPKVGTLPKGLKVLSDGEEYLTAALALGFLGQSSIRTAKEILFSSGNKTLWSEHQAAMTPSSLASMIGDLQKWIVAGSNDAYEMGRNTIPPHNLFDLANAINALSPQSIGLDVESFMKSYRRRSISRVPGTRLEDGSIQPARARLVPRTNARTYITGIEFNSADASVQVGTEKPVWVERASDGQVLQEVAFVGLDSLRDVRTYTLISSGERNVENLPLEIYKKDAHAALSPFMIPSEAAKPFTPGQKVRIALKRFRMESGDAPSVTQLFDAVLSRMKALTQVKILGEMQDKVAASPYTAEQVEALKELHLSPKLNFSAPTTVHYTDRDAAIRDGSIDSFTRFKIQFGTLDVRSPGDFRSGNAFLQRRYSVVNADGEKLEKPTLAGYLQGDKYTLKPPGKGKDTAADDLMGMVLDGILSAKVRLTNEEITAKLSAAQKASQESVDLFQGLVMEIGCTGLIPLELEESLTRYEPEDFATKFQQKLSKDEKEGIFFVAKNGLVISITPETSWYTVQKPGETDVDVAA